MRRWRRNCDWLGDAVLEAIQGSDVDLSIRSVNYLRKDDELAFRVSSRDGWIDIILMSVGEVRFADQALLRNALVAELQDSLRSEETRNGGLIDIGLASLAAALPTRDRNHC